jgi:hypothetical protein
MQFANQTRNLINERSTVWNPEKRNSANKILNSIICTHHRRRDQAPQREGNYGQALREKATMAKLSERRQLWPSSQERPWPFPRCELNEYIFDDLQFAVQTRNFAKKERSTIWYPERKTKRCQ